MSQEVHTPPGDGASPKNTGAARRLRTAMFVCLGLLLALNLFIRPHDPHFGLDALPGFWALFGLAGAVILAKGAKGAAHTFLGKNEDFYEKKE